jgi:hypothetical protein
MGGLMHQRIGTLERGPQSLGTLKGLGENLAKVF